MSVSYISEDEAKNEINILLKDRAEMKQVLQLLQLKYNIPEQFMRKLSQTIGYGYKSNMIKSPEGIINETKSSQGGKLTKSKKHKKVKKSYKLVKKSKRKTRKYIKK